MGEVGGAPSGPPLGSAFVTAKAGMMQVVIVEVGAIRFCNAAARVSAVGAVVRRVVVKASGSLVPPARPGGLFAIATVCAKTPTSDSPRVRVSPVLHLVPPTCREVPHVPDRLFPGFNVQRLQLRHTTHRLSGTSAPWSVASATAVSEETFQRCCISHHTVHITLCGRAWSRPESACKSRRKEPIPVEPNTYTHGYMYLLTLTCEGCDGPDGI